MCVCVCVCVCVCMQSCFSHIWLFATLWTVARQASLSLGFSRQEYWSGLSCPPPENLLNPGVDHVSFVSPAVAGRFFTTNATWEAPYTYIFFFIFFSIVVFYRILHTVLCAMQLLSVHSIYNSLHMLIPNSIQCFPTFHHFLFTGCHNHLPGFPPCLPTRLFCWYTLPSQPLNVHSWI